MLYEDDDLVIYNKPPFLAMHPAKRHQSDTLANVYAASHPESTFRPVYRLDRDTDGICVCAKNALAASRLAGRVEKTYTCLLYTSVAEMVSERLKRNDMPSDTADYEKIDHITLQDEIIYRKPDGEEPKEPPKEEPPAEQEQK